MFNQPVQFTDGLLGQNGGFSALGGSQSIANVLLANNFNINALRTEATLRKDEWIQYDKAVIDIARSRLVGVNDLMSRGLVYNLPNALGVTRLEWEQVSDMNGADMTMSGISESQNDRVLFNLVGMPIPIIHKDFNINVRALEASRKTGQPLDTVQAAVAGRKVAEMIETTLFAGATVLGSNNPIYGYKTAPNRNTGSLTGNWASLTGSSIITDILTMMGRMIGDNMYGPYWIYVPADAWVHLGDDFKANSDKTIMSRISEIAGISGVSMSKDLSSGEVLMVQFSPDVVEMVDGIQPTTVQWESHAGFVVHFKVLAIMVPRIRNDYILQSGIVHYSYP